MHVCLTIWSNDFSICLHLWHSFVNISDELMMFEFHHIKNNWRHFLHTLTQTYTTWPIFLNLVLVWWCYNVKIQNESFHQFDQQSIGNWWRIRRIRHQFNLNCTIKFCCYENDDANACHMARPALRYIHTHTNSPPCVGVVLLERDI